MENRDTGRVTKLRWDLPIGRNLRDGLTITGYLRSEIGLGQAARNLSYAADQNQLPVSMRHLPLPDRENDLEFASKSNSVSERRGNLFVLGLPSISSLQPELQVGQSNILYPFWELSDVPTELIQHLKSFDEIWAPSRFVASAFDGFKNLKVSFLPVPVRVAPVMPAANAMSEKLKVFTFFDFDSFGSRKNPQAAIAAFKAAFHPQKNDVELTIKTRGESDKGLRIWLKDVAMKDSRIKIIDKTLSREEVDRLLLDSDVFISMHRSEGFGFGAAEALAAGKAVVATDYGGTTDFINSSTGYPVPFKLIALKKGDYIHGKGQSWADPSVEAAAEALKLIYDFPDDAKAKAKDGFDLLSKQFSTAAVGRKMKVLMKGAGLVDPNGA